MTDLFADTLREIQKTAIAAAGAKDKAQILTLPEPDGRYAIVGHDGQVKRFTPDPPARSHTVGSLDDLIQATLHYACGDKQPGAVWYSENEIVTVIDDTAGSRRLDRVRLPLRKTPAFEFFAREAADRWFPQKAFVRFLRVDLAGCLTARSEVLLKAVRLISCTKSETGYGKAELGRESIGRDLDMQLKSDGVEIPETVTFNVRVFHDPCLTAKSELVCAVDCDPKSFEFNLCPSPEAVRDLVDEELSVIEGRLSASINTIPIFRGSP